MHSNIKYKTKTVSTGNPVHPDNSNSDSQCARKDNTVHYNDVDRGLSPLAESELEQVSSSNVINSLVQRMYRFSSTWVVIFDQLVILENGSTT